jgi:hypothetical protein
MAKRKARNGKRGADPDKLTLNGESVKFQVQEDRKKAVMTLNYTRHTAEGLKELSVEMLVFAIWMDNETGNAIKAHAYANPSNPQHRSLIADLRKCGKVRFSGEFCITTDGTFIRYGKTSREHYHTYNYEASQSHTIYDSKAQALAGILEQIGRTQTIGGLNLVSLNRLPDSILAEMGYEEVPDLMRKQGIGMWKGSPIQAIGQEYGLEATKQRKQFLDLLGKAINAE